MSLTPTLTLTLTLILTLATPNPNPNPNQVRSRQVELDHPLICLEDLGEAFVSPPEGAEGAELS